MIMRLDGVGQHSCFACGRLRAIAGLHSRVYALRCSSVDETEQCGHTEPPKCLAKKKLAVL